MSEDIGSVFKETATRIQKERPLISTAAVFENTSREEQFQNEIIRPIIKMQHGVLIELAKQQMNKSKKEFSQLNSDGQYTMIEQFLQNQPIRSLFIGLILGQMSLTELKKYAELSSALNRRIVNIIKKRLKDSIKELQS